MRRNTDAKKLQLSRETMRRLAGGQLVRVAGGMAPCTSGDARCTCPSFIDTTDCAGVAGDTNDCQPG